MASRVIHTIAQDAARLLGAQIRAARIERGWTVAELAERAEVASRTILKVEHGDATVALGTALECAVLVGVPLFYEDEHRLAAEAARGRAPLLKRRVRRPPAPKIDLDF